MFTANHASCWPEVRLHPRSARPPSGCLQGIGHRFEPLHDAVEAAVELGGQRVEAPVHGVEPPIDLGAKRVEARIDGGEAFSVWPARTSWLC